MICVWSEASSWWNESKLNLWQLSFLWPCSFKIEWWLPFSCSWTFRISSFHFWEKNILWLVRDFLIFQNDYKNFKVGRLPETLFLQQSLIINPMKKCELCLRCSVGVSCSYWDLKRHLLCYSMVLWVCDMDNTVPFENWGWTQVVKRSKQTALFNMWPNQHFLLFRLLGNV